MTKNVTIKIIPAAKKNEQCFVNPSWNTLQHCLQHRQRKWRFGQSKN